MTSKMTDEGAGKRQLRYLEARLKLVVSSLPATVIFNPMMTALAASAFLIGPDTFGAVPLRNIAAAIAIQFVSSTIAWTVYRSNRDSTRPADERQRELIGMQAVYSVVWGLVFWLFWRAGNPVNNIFVTLIMVCVVWAATFTRSAHRGVFLTGTLTVGVFYIARLATTTGTVAHVLEIIAPLWLAYIFLMGEAARRHIDEMLSVGFANEDLTEELLLARDDAQHKRYEAEAANASKTAFLANMSHELRTPLNAILGFSDIIADQSFGDAIERYREYARDIHNSGVHLLSLINDLLDVAKIEAGKMEIDPQPLDIKFLFQSVQRLVGPRALANGQSLGFTIAPGLAPLVADARALKQIILNLLSNAVKFTPQGGHITVACRAAEDGGFIVSVEDDGPGIPEEKLSKIFTPFSQVDNRYDSNGGGTGLGLSLVQGLAQLHRGKAWIESEEGAGTKVMVYFPLTVAAPKSDLQSVA